MAWYWWPIIYAGGFGATFIFNAMIGPVMPSLALLRAFIWPLALVSTILQVADRLWEGERQGPDG